MSERVLAIQYIDAYRNGSIFKSSGFADRSWSKHPLVYFFIEFHRHTILLHFWMIFIPIKCTKWYEFPPSKKGNRSVRYPPGLDPSRTATSYYGSRWCVLPL